MAKVKCMNISIRALSCPENGDASFGVFEEGYTQTVDDQAGTGLYKYAIRCRFPGNSIVLDIHVPFTLRV